MGGGLAAATRTPLHHRHAELDSAPTAPQSTQVLIVRGLQPRMLFWGSVTPAQCLLGSQIRGTRSGTASPGPSASLQETAHLSQTVQCRH